MRRGLLSFQTMLSCSTPYPEVYPDASHCVLSADADTQKLAERFWQPMEFLALGISGGYGEQVMSRIASQESSDVTKAWRPEPHMVGHAAGCAEANGQDDGGHNHDHGRLASQKWL
ncbi:hypothetical protein C8035_v002256 [Colletotrichum spinosum]|uniref:Uncharacterized protein n=1 Tax=Colletotrichum spinosum TaxID=1347390 RepID=A0A4R8Q1S2_9PEZI|nr:hypothetical protein C8035_v002256 [Colletotrichum spinosum]